MLHACVQRFDVTGNLEKFYKILGTKQAPTIKVDRACEQNMLSDEESEDLVSPYLLKKYV